MKAEKEWIFKGLTDYGKRNLSPDDVHDLEQMAGCRVSLQRADIFMMPDGVGTHVDFLELEPVVDEESKEMFTKAEVKEIALKFTKAATPSRLMDGVEERFNKLWDINFPTIIKILIIAIALTGCEKNDYVVENVDTLLYYSDEPDVYYVSVGEEPSRGWQSKDNGDTYTFSNEQGIVTINSSNALKRAKFIRNTEVLSKHTSYDVEINNNSFTAEMGAEFVVLRVWR